MSTFDRAADETRSLAAEIASSLSGGPAGSAAGAIVERLDGPLRVAIAGRVKAGKSTLLNALVGERLAPTDAGECTKIVTSYARGDSYRVSASLNDGSAVELPFERADGHLDIDLGGRTEAQIRSIDVRWPTGTLASMILIDTPGLASLNAENSRRTIDFMQPEGDGTSEVDAVIYLMRHLHREDVSFLDAFMDRGVAAASAVNAIGVLSRADEIGAGRLDAVDSATRIARRYESDPTMFRLVSAVVPVAGLVAETGLTLTEAEMGPIRAIASVETEARERMLLSSATLLAPEAAEIDVESRRAMLSRLGLYGVRVSVDLIARGEAKTAADLGPKLVEVSGLRELERRIDEQFSPRARVLKTRSALSALRSLATEVERSDDAVARKIRSECERIEASAIEFTRIRAAHLVAYDAVDIPDAEQTELATLLLGSTPAAALGVSGDDRIRQAAQDGIARWRTRAADPMADSTTREVFEAGARTCEHILASQS